MSTIITRNSATSGSIPSSLIQGELAINVTNNRLFYGSGSGNVVQEFGVTSSYAQTASFVQNAQTASFVQNAQTASFTPNALVTASVSSNTITFTKGNGTTFPITVNTGSGGGAAFPFTGSALITGSLGVTGSISTSGSNGTINSLFFSTGGGNVASNISIGVTTNFSSSATGTDNFAAGNLALCRNTTGVSNTAIGPSTLRANTTGCRNTAIGQYALCANSTGNNNTSIGQESLRFNTTGCYNIAIGPTALTANTTSNNNTALGNSALNKNTTGASNTAIGRAALACNTIGSNNIAFGQQAGCLFSGSSSNNIAIGFGAGPSTLTDESNKLYIASGSGVPLIKGDFALKTVNISGSLTSTSFTGSLLGTASFASTASFTPNAITTASVSSNTITFTKGNGTTFPITVNTGSGGATSPGGSDTQIQYNNVGAFGGASALTFDGTTITANPITATGYFIPKNAVGSLSTFGGDYTISEPGVYRFTTMDSGGAYYINFPDPSTPEDGQIIIIINSDALYAGYYGATYQPQDALGTAIPIIGAGQVDTFVNMEGMWIRTSRRP